MKTCLKTLMLIAATLLAANSSWAAIVQIGQYGLGESGTVGASAPFTPLSDSVGTANNITAFQAGGATTSIFTGTLAAPGSTAALQITGNEGGSSGWFAGAGYGLTDNWATDIWIRPDANGGTFAFATDNASTGLVTHYQNGTPVVNLIRDIFLGSQAVLPGGSYTVGTWQQLTTIVSNGTASFYNNQALAGTLSVTGSSVLNNPMFGFGPGGTAGTNAVFDELRVWQFGPGDSVTSVSNVIFGVPEPGTFAMLLFGSVAMWIVRRKRG